MSRRARRRPVIKEITEDDLAAVAEIDRIRCSVLPLPIAERLSKAITKAQAGGN